MVKQLGLKRDSKGRLVKGTPPGPGRPVGSITVIGRLKQMFEEDPEDFEKFVKGYKMNKDNAKHITEMIDGKPMQRLEHGGNVEFNINIIKYED